jgi:hypothetical protein
MKARIVLLALLIGASHGMHARADEKPDTLTAPKDVSAPAPTPPHAVQPSENCCGCNSSVSRCRKVWEWLTYRSLPARECHSVCCDSPAMPPLYTYFLDCRCQSGCQHNACQSGCQRNAPACDSTSQRAPCRWLNSWTDLGKLTRPAE